MPEFATPFAGLANDRKLTDEELIRAVRYSIAAEYEAVQLYRQLAESTDNELAVEVLKDIADEDLVHVGEFLRLLRRLAPKEAEFYAEGAEEVEEMMEKLGTKAGNKQEPPEGEDPGGGLPYCTTAPDAEHARGYRQEEPCDDATAGKLEEE